MNPHHHFSILAIIQLLRPKQWIKNIFVLAPLFFSGAFVHIISIQQALVAFLLFCLAASATYVLNDYNDIEKDKKHPTKSKQRPLASGEATKTQAIILLISLLIALGISALFYPKIMSVITAYLLLNVAYTFYLKHQPIFDIFTIATGFILRVYVGAIAINAPLSSWMFITTLSLALYLASIKRKQELLKETDGTRDVLQHYTIELMDKYAQLSATCAILFYSLFILSDKPNMVYTIPFVLFGIYRYWFIVETQNHGESPTDSLASDIPLQITVIGWALSCGYTLLTA